MDAAAVTRCGADLAKYTEAFGAVVRCLPHGIEIEERNGGGRVPDVLRESITVNVLAVERATQLLVEVLTTQPLNPARLVRDLQVFSGTLSLLTVDGRRLNSWQQDSRHAAERALMN